MNRAAPTIKGLLVLGLAGAAALSGCITDWGHCGPFFSSMQWHQDDLYPAFAQTTLWAGWDPGNGALPWTNTWDNLTGLRLAEARLQVDRPEFHSRGNIAYADPHLSHISLLRDGVVYAFVEGNVSDDVVLTAFHRMADQTTLAPPSELEAAAQAFLDSRRDAGSRSAVPLDDDGTSWMEFYHWEYTALLPGPLKLDELVASQGIEAPAGQTPGRAESSLGNWSFTFTLPTWVLENGTGSSLTVDVRGMASFQAGRSHDTLESLQEEAQDLARQANLPRLQLDGVEAVASIC